MSEKFNRYWLKHGKLPPVNFHRVTEHLILEIKVYIFDTRFIFFLLNLFWGKKEMSQSEIWKCIVKYKVVFCTDKILSLRNL